MSESTSCLLCARTPSGFSLPPHCGRPRAWGTRGIQQRLKELTGKEKPAGRGKDFTLVGLMRSCIYWEVNEQTSVGTQKRDSRVGETG